MPFLDVTDVLLDPDFVDQSLVCYRRCRRWTKIIFRLIPRRLFRSLVS